MDELPGRAREAFADEVVYLAERGGGAFYPHEEFLGAFQEALLARVAGVVPEGASQRQVIAALGALRSAASHQAVLTEALGTLKARGHPLAEPGERRVVAVFTAPT